MCVPQLFITGMYSGEWLTKTIFVFRGLGSMDNCIEYGVLTPDHTNLTKVRGSGTSDPRPLATYLGLEDLEIWTGEAG